MKKCKECHELKPLEEFHRHCHMKDGRLNYCKSCCNTKRSGSGQLAELPVGKKIAATKRHTQIAKYGLEIVETLEHRNDSMSVDDAMHLINGY